MPTTAIEALGDLLARPEGSWSLADGALAIARLHRPGLDPAQVVGRLDALGASARAAVGAAVHPRFVAAGVGKVLFRDEGFRTPNRGEGSPDWLQWQDEAIPLLRTLVNDVGTPYTYSDQKLEEVFVHAAYLVNQRTTFSTTYTITLSSTSITPDPSSDPTFIYLVALKAALLIVCNEAKTLAGQAFRVTDGPSSIDISGAFNATSKLCDKLTEQFEDALLQDNNGGAMSVGGEAVISPYTQERLSNHTFY